jgi:hypothetical protein
MKTLLICFLLLPNFYQSGTDFRSFAKFVLQNLKTTTEINRNCDWQYAVVKMTTDVNGKVTKVEILNNDAYRINMSFNYLIGYVFDKKLGIIKKPVVFYYTEDNGNLGKACDVPPQYHQPADVTTKLLALFNTQRKKEPSTVFIYEPIVGKVYPPEY